MCKINEFTEYSTFMFRVGCKFTQKANLLHKTMNTKVPWPKYLFSFPARLGLRMIFYWRGISLGMFNDDLGQKISKIRYHYFQNWHFCSLGCIFEIKMMMDIFLGVIRFQIRGLFEKKFRNPKNKISKIFFNFKDL